MKSENKKLLSGIVILVGTIIGAGILGIPYVSARSGFLVGLGYILFFGAIITFIHLCVGEIALRTKENHQLSGYSEKYLGKKAKKIMNFAFFFSIYSAIIAYTFGVGESISFLIFKNFSYSILFGVSFALVMSFFIWRGLTTLKKYEKIGVSIILFLILMIVLIFFKDISASNLTNFNEQYFFLPIGVILFAYLGIYSIPEINFILKKNKKSMKKILFFGTIISMIIYAFFAFIIVGLNGDNTPEIATLSLGPIFIFLGIFTIFTSYLALGNALKDSLIYDSKYNKFKSWFLSTIVPIFLFLFIKLFDYFSFTKILSIGGVVSGGLIAIIVLFTLRKAKINGDRVPEYSLPLNKFLIFFLSLIFILAIIREIWIMFI